MTLLRRLVFLALIALAVYGFLAGNLIRQVLWNESGLQRVFVFSAVYVVFCAAMWFSKRQWLLPAMGVTMIVHTALAVGPRAPLVVAFFLLSCWLVGDLAIGLALFVTLAGIAMHFPINYWWVYLIALSIPFLRWRTPQMRLPECPFWMGAVAGLPIVAQWLLTLKPESSTDGLAMHLAVPAYVAHHHLWPFDVTRFSWAVTPMNGDWAFTIVYMLGGESAAKLLNAALLLVVLWMLWDMTRSVLVVGLCASMPIVQLVTGSIMVENLLVLFILAGVRAIDRLRRDGDARHLYFFAIVSGAALATKFGAVAYIVPAAGFAALALRRTPNRWRAAALSFVILLCLAAPPYVNAWQRTGNPLFPFQNHIFRAAHFDDTQPFVDSRFGGGLSWSVLYDAAFQSRKYLEGQDGSLGFQFVLFLPLSLLFLRRDTPYLVKMSLAVAVAGFMLVFSQNSNLRYVYPAMVLAGIVMAWALEQAQAQDSKLAHVWTGAAAVVVILNFWFLPSAGWYVNDFYFNTPRSAGRENRYIEDAVPTRKLVQYLNNKPGGAPVCYLESNQIAGLHRRAYTNSWHNWEFFIQLHESRSPEQDAKLFQELGIEYFIAPTRESGIVASRPHLWAFLDQYTERELVIGRYHLARWKR